MFVPAIATLITQKFIWKEPLRDLGLGTPRLSWLAVAWLLPVALVIVALAFSLLVPGVSLISGLDGLIAKLADMLLPGEVARAQREMGRTILAKPGVLLVISFAQVLMAGPSINAVAAFGEELGWRGLLWHELKPLGFWRASLMIGFFWGLWHLPVIVNGYNYPGHPVAGPIMMISLAMLITADRLCTLARRIRLRRRGLPRHVQRRRHSGGFPGRRQCSGHGNYRRHRNGHAVAGQRWPLAPPPTPKPRNLTRHRFAALSPDPFPFPGLAEILSLILMLRAGGTASSGLSLLQIVDLNQADAGRVVYPAHDGGVIARGEQTDEGRFQVVRRRESGGFDLRLLAAPIRTRFPIIVAGDRGSVSIMQFQGRIAQRPRHAGIRERWS
jgi:membrane protease YdiL (CAAX protease family)